MDWNPAIRASSLATVESLVMWLITFDECKWIHFVRLFCKDLVKYNLEYSVTADAIADNEKKNRRILRVRKASDLVVAVWLSISKKLSKKSARFQRRSHYSKEFRILPIQQIKAHQEKMSFASLRSVEEALRTLN